MRRDLSSQVGCVQLRVGVGGVPVSGSPAREHHVAAIHGALVHLPQVHRREVNLEGSLITKGLETDIALDALLSGCWAHVADSDVVTEFLLDLLLNPVLHRVRVAAVLLGVVGIILWLPVPGFAVGAVSVVERGLVEVVEMIFATKVAAWGCARKVEGVVGCSCGCGHAGGLSFKGRLSGSALSFALSLEDRDKT